MNGILKLLISLILGLMLHVKHWGQVAVLELHGVHEMSGLLVCWRVDTIEMVGPTGKAVLTSLIEILFEVLVGLRSPLRRLDHHETDGALIDEPVVLQFIPVDTALMMRDVDTVNFITLRIADVTVKGAPTESEG